MKTCSKCKEEKEEKCFSKDSSKVDGLRTTCKVCKAETDKIYAKKKADEISIKRRERYLRNYERERNQQKEYSKNNRELFRELNRKWRSNNKGKVNAATRKRQASKLRATPIWLSQEDHKRIENIYEVCAKVTNQTGKDHHVDHVIPLRGDNVCGLHVPWNLAIIPAKMNMSKGNRI